MTEPLAATRHDPVGEQGAGRRLPRALTPFRTPAYRWLAVSLTASSFAAGVWVVALVWEVIALGGVRATCRSSPRRARSACCSPPWSPGSWPTACRSA